MKYRTSAAFRQLFLDFFVTKNHVIEPSSSLVPQDDPTLLWINSGVAALKKYFDGSITPAARRIVNAQKCLRANDIENVGVTARHHTFFEMLGNFSIGDYFRSEAIDYAWEFLTSDEWVGFDPDKLYVTVYPSDHASFNYWHDKIGLTPDHIILCEDNFWEIGEGPCGPCTEIFYDRGPTFNGKTPKEALTVGGENDRYIEIWNIVFSQFDAKPNVPREAYPELPTKNIDTGMGFERMVAILQNGKTNFDTDLFLPIIAAIEQKTNIKYAQADTEQEIAFKLIADHIRAITFAIADGALPSNEGRGYVIRRLLRRAMRYAKKLNIDGVFLSNLVAVVVEIMKSYYWYLVDKQDLIVQVVRAEEEKFLATLTEGEKKLTEFIEQAKKGTISGEAAFTLYDTYGFPFELTQEIALQAGMRVDKKGFDMHMDQQRARARKARQVEQSMQQQNELLQNFTDPSEFVGYTTLTAEVKPLLIAQGDQKLTHLSSGQQGILILDKTPFYALGGGQVSDDGKLYNDNALAIVNGVKRAPNGQHLHFITVVSGSIDTASILTAVVDVQKRRATERNHTATHLLQAALRKTLGEHVEQAGSYVDSQRLRFDFTHYKAISPSQLAAIELQVNEMIWQNIDMSIEIMSLSEAKKMGAMAFFGEKYGDNVRVVQAGTSSIELCAGTHVKNTADIGIFKITSESGIGSGVRRIEAITSQTVYRYLQADEQLITDLQKTLKRKNRSELKPHLEHLLQERKTLLHKLTALQKASALITLQAAIDKPIQINDQSIIYAAFSGLSVQELKQMVDLLKERLIHYIAVLVSTANDQTNIVVAVCPDETKKVNSNEVIQALNAGLNGRGGGKAELAQATIKKAVTKQEIVKILRNIVK